MRTPNKKPRLSRLLSTAVAGSLAVVALAACGDSGNSGSTDGGSAPQSAPSGFPGGQRPAASGLIAAVDATTMQVQSQQSGQVAVRWTDTTTFSQTVTVTVSSLKAGDCVTAVAPSGTDQNATSFTATTVTVRQSTNGECGMDGGMGGPGGGNGGGNGQAPSGRPTGMPGGMPSGAPGGGNFGGVASGKVVSVSGSSVVIDATSFDPNQGSASTTVQKTVTVGSGTKVTGTASATSEAVAVGKCATAQGSADDTGTVTATSISLSEADNGQCTGGFGGFNGNR